MSSDLENNQSISRLLKLNIPPKHKRKRTSFDISGTARKEVIISRWYGYLLRRNEDHELDNLFLKALIECLPVEAQQRFQLNQYKVRLEVATAAGNRIDLMIEGEGHDRGKYILIENKIDHWLHNDLLDYWMFPKGDERYKVGILLTVAEESIPQNVTGRFHNVLHKDWMANISKHLLSAGGVHNQRQDITDFINNIMNLHTDTELNDRVAFFIQHAKQINQLAQTKQSTYTYLTRNIEMLAKPLGCRYERPPNDRLVYLHPQGIKEVSYVVKFEDLFSPDLDRQPQLEISTVPEGTAFQMVDKLDEVFRDQIPSTILRREKEGNGWCHYLMKRVPATLDTMTRLQEIVKAEIESLRPLTEKIIQTLKGNA